ncbi:MAG: TatD family hydrolase [Bacillota bacterium]
MAARSPDLVRVMGIDTHSHVSMDDFDGDRAAVVERARVAGVNFVEIGFDASSSRKAISLAGNLGGVCAVGIHPHNVGATREELAGAWREVESLLAGGNSEVAAIGEIGLDFARDLNPRDLQTKCFAAGLELARNAGLPVVIHQRDAEEQVLGMVRDAALTAPVIFHCFTGNAEYASKCLALGGYLGFGGVLTYPRNQALREALGGLPLDRILLETDSPYLAPQSRRGKRNEPAFVLEVGQLVAGLLGLPLERVLAATSANAAAAFMADPDWKEHPQLVHPA